MYQEHGLTSQVGAALKGVALTQGKRYAMRQIAIVCGVLLLAAGLITSCEGAGESGPGNGLTFTVRYDANYPDADPANVPVDGSLYAEGTTVTVKGPGTMVRAGFDFVNWNTASDGSGTTRLPGGTFVMGNANVVLYAMWDAIEGWGIGEVDVEVEDTTGEVDVEAGKGGEVDVEVDDTTGDVDVEAGEGGEVDVEVDDSNGDATVEAD